MAVIRAMSTSTAATTRSSRGNGMVALARDHARTLALLPRLRLVARPVPVARDQYLHFRYARYDLGNMVQAVWSTATVARST